MTTVELERVARDVVQPAGASMVAVVVDVPPHPAKTIYGASWLLGGLRQSRPFFTGSQRDTYRLMDILEGRDPTPRSRPELASRSLGAAGEPVQVEAEAPDLPGGPEALERRCAGCDQPLPSDARSNRRTHDGACRVAAARHRAAEISGRADADGGASPVTVSDGSGEPGPDTAVIPAGVLDLPGRDARGAAQLRLPLLGAP